MTFYRGAKLCLLRTFSFPSNKICYNYISHFLSLPGCCFVTFYKRKHALEAQNALHNIKTLPGVSLSFPRLICAESET